MCMLFDLFTNSKLVFTFLSKTVLHNHSKARWYGAQLPKTQIKPYSTRRHPFVWVLRKINIAEPSCMDFGWCYWDLCGSSGIYIRIRITNIEVEASFLKYCRDIPFVFFLFIFHHKLWLLLEIHPFIFCCILQA